MARRTRAWWAALSAVEKVEIFWLDRAGGGKKVNYCTYCIGRPSETNDPLCWRCRTKRKEIIAKADKAVEADDETPT